MTPLLPVVTLIGALEITAPVWAQRIPAPDTALGRAVVLRGSPVSPRATGTMGESIVRPFTNRSPMPLHGDGILISIPPVLIGNFDTSGLIGTLIGPALLAKSRLDQMTARAP
jgi:hypothetical protein